MSIHSIDSSNEYPRFLWRTVENHQVPTLPILLLSLGYHKIPKYSDTQKIANLL